MGVARVHCVAAEPEYDHPVELAPAQGSHLSLSQSTVFGETE